MFDITLHIIDKTIIITSEWIVAIVVVFFIIWFMGKILPYLGGC